MYIFIIFQDVVSSVASLEFDAESVALSRHRNTIKKIFNCVQHNLVENLIIYYV